MKMKNKIKKTMIILIWLLIWQMAAIFIHNDILLAGPVEVGRTLVRLLFTADFYRICMASLGRILLGFGLAFVTGAFLGALSYKFPLIKEAASPVLSVMKSIPVASFVVLLLIWQGAENLSVWISFFVVFPNVCISTGNGLEAVDPKLKEMADVFRIRGIKRALYIYRPSLCMFLMAGMEISIGMAFKSGVAAEVIGVPDFSIGERIYVSKIYLDTPGLFAWTLALILLSFLMEKLILKAMGFLTGPVKSGGNVSVQKKHQNEEKWKKEETGQMKGTREYAVTSSPRKFVRLSHISRSFGEKKVLTDVNMELQKGKCYLLMGPSGSGKTTLLRILAGLEKADSGHIQEIAGKDSADPVYEQEICYGHSCSLMTAYMFQEDRLLDKEFTITNIMLTTKNMSRQQVEEAVNSILPRPCLYMPVWTLSGGMKRRCALARTLFYEKDNEDAICLLDEPFAGLDDETKERAADFIKRYLKGRTLIVATHDEKDAELLGGSIWRIAK